MLRASSIGDGFAPPHAGGAVEVEEVIGPECWAKGRVLSQPFTLQDMINGLGWDIRNISRAKEMQLSNALRALGYGQQRVRIDGVRTRMWAKSN